jgi:hypothetical protein
MVEVIDVDEGYARYSLVTLVMDPHFGAKAKAYAEIGPLWLIESVENKAIVEEIWAAGKTRFFAAPTYFDRLFDPMDDVARELRVAQVIWAMDDHHPEWQKFEIIGHPLTDGVLKAFGECAPGYAETTSQGFVFHRTGPRVQVTLT